MAIVPLDVNPGPFRYQEQEFFLAGVDTFSAPTEQRLEGGWTQLDNVMPPVDGSIKRRRGYSLFYDTGGVDIRKMYEFQTDVTGFRRIILTSSTAVRSITEAGAAHNAAIFAPSGGAGTVRVVNSRDYAYFADGVAADLKKWDGSSPGGVTKWGITAPATAISVGVAGAGAITLLTGRNYFVAYKNSTTGHVSDISPISPSTGQLTANNIPLSSIAVSGDAQVDKKLVLATGDGGDAGVLYLLTELANAVTVYTDNTPEETLLLQNIYLETDNFGVETGITENTPPPSLGTLPIKHAGRLFLAVGQILWFSKNLQEVTTSTGTVTSKYEEAWPGDNQLDISVGAETVRGLFSDGESLYIGTERHIRRIQGDSPSNFSTSDVIFNQTGVMNQEVWQTVFAEGSPKGTMWLSPDKRVFMSDYNTYVDMGTAIQDQLDTINVTYAATRAWSMFVSDGEYDLYLLNVPTGVNTEPNRTFVFNLRTKKWVTWTLTDNMQSGLFTITAAGAVNWIVSASGGKLYLLDSSTQDRVSATPVSFTSTVQTQWLDFGDGTTRKVLNEMDVQTADATVRVSVEGASTRAEFNSPLTVATNRPLVAGPFGDYKVFLAGKVSKSRYYRFTFVSTSTSSPILDSWSVEGVGVNRL